jgi:hypothetical protein
MFGCVCNGQSLAGFGRVLGLSHPISHNTVLSQAKKKSELIYRRTCYKYTSTLDCKSISTDGSKIMAGAYFVSAGRAFQKIGDGLPHQRPQNAGPKKIVILNLLNFINLARFHRN